MNVKQNQRSIDEQAIERLADLSRQSSTDLLREVIELFKTDGEASLKAMRAAVAKGDFVTTAKLAHTLKSSAATLGALQVQDLAAAVEKAKPESEVILNLLTAMEREFVAAMRELQDYAGPLESK